MGTGNRRRRCTLRKAYCAAVLLFAVVMPPAQAQSREALQNCLSGFDGIIWTLPYSPRLSAGNCSSDVQHSRIEFFTHSVLEHDEPGMSSDARFSAEENALLAHFDNLFLRQGYRRLDTQLSDNPATPYVQRARFVRASSAGDFVLIYEAVAANVVRITLEKPAVAAEKSGVAP